jgi:hypothetical protein
VNAGRIVRQKIGKICNCEERVVIMNKNLMSFNPLKIICLKKVTQCVPRN